jgi:hypothetical protein
VKKISESTKKTDIADTVKKACIRGAQKCDKKEHCGNKPFAPGGAWFAKSGIEVAIRGISGRREELKLGEITAHNNKGLSADAGERLS